MQKWSVNKSPKRNLGNGFRSQMKRRYWKDLSTWASIVIHERWKVIYKRITCSLDLSTRWSTYFDSCSNQGKEWIMIVEINPFNNCIIVCYTPRVAHTIQHRQNICHHGNSMVLNNSCRPSFLSRATWRILPDSHKSEYQSIIILLLTRI